MAASRSRREETAAARAAVVEMLRQDIRSGFPSNIRHVDGPREFKRGYVYFRVYPRGRKKPVYLPYNRETEALVEEWRRVKEERVVRPVDGAAVAARLDAAARLLLRAAAEFREQAARIDQRIEEAVAPLYAKLGEIERRLAEIEAAVEAMERRARAAPAPVSAAAAPVSPAPRRAASVEAAPPVAGEGDREALPSYMRDNPWVKVLGRRRRQ